MGHRGWFIFWSIITALILAPPALLLFGQWERESRRDRQNREAFDHPGSPVAALSAELFVPDGTAPGELRRFGKGTLMRALALSPDGRSVVAAGTDNNLRLWTLDDRSSTTYPMSCGNINALQYMPDGNRVLVGPIGVPFLWDLTSSRMTYLNTGQANQVEQLAVSPNGYTAATGSSNQPVHIWNLSTAWHIGIIGAHENAGTIAVAYSADGQRIHSAAGSGDLHIWNLKTGQTLMKSHHDRSWMEAAFSPDGRLLLASSGPEVALYDVDDQGSQRFRFRAHQSFVNGVAFSRDASCFATVAGSEIALWETATGNRISTLRLPAQRHVNGALAILPTNRHILFGGDGISLILMPAPNPDPATAP